MNIKNIRCIVLTLALFLTMPAFSQTAASSSPKKIVTIYLLIDEPAQLQRYVDDLSKVEKVNFNRIIFSFARPTLTQYRSGNLANTGILGYFDEHDGQGVAMFQKLKEAIRLSHEKHIESLLSVGGWNYSCNFDDYGNACGPAPSADGAHYDWFPDPNEPTQAETARISYTNLVTLANDLGVDGIDLDYEEFWHADKYAVQWGPSSSGEWSTEIARRVIEAGGPSYDNLMQYGTNAGSAYVMPKTVDKVAAILHAIADNPDATHLKIASAAPPVGARPITGFVYGDRNPDIYTRGGVWWKGNLKGLWYHLAQKDEAIVSRVDSIGLMTYDLCGDNAQVCAPYQGASLDLPSQVTAYMKDYTNWLKATSPQAAELSVDSIGKVTYLPAKYQISTKIQFGFEVNQPAYPQNPQGQLQLTVPLVDTITAQQKDSDGVIIWQMYSKQNTAVSGAASVKYTLAQSCKQFLADDANVDCDANFPASLENK
jgi:hypothetical protein